MPRCPKGTRKNKSGICVKKGKQNETLDYCIQQCVIKHKEKSPSQISLSSPPKKKRCPKGTKRNKAGICVEKINSKKSLLESADTPRKEYAKNYFNAPRCSFIEKKSYCRLSHKYKMDKKCNVTKRLKSAEMKNKSARVIQKALKNKRASNIVARFMRRTTQKRRAEFLKAICADSGACMAFGTNRKKILDFFGGFTNMDYAISPIKSIGNPSVNGFVKEIKYEKRGYNSFAVLKSAANADADNLAYEYIVGQFINIQAKRFPCFIDTYGLYYYNSDAAWQHAERSVNINANVLRRDLILQKDPFNYKKMCEESKYCAILVEHLKGVKSIGDILYNSATVSQVHEFILFALPFILYQIYLPLSLLRTVFTHYDLHHDNVLLYEPIKGKHIKYHYHLNSGVVTFNSPYIVKIIDYGRSFYKSNTLIKPREIYDHLCAEPDCDKCGWNSGLSWLDPVLEDDNFFISSSIVNPSHDLRLLDIIRNEMYNPQNSNISRLSQNSRALYNTIDDLLNKVVYRVGITDPDKVHAGTEPNRASGLPNAINHVGDAEREIRNLLNNPYLKSINNMKYVDATKIGDMHIYEDGRPVSFIHA